MKPISFSKRALKALGCSAFVVLLSAASQADAQTSYSTTFAGFDRTSPLSGQDGWVNNDANQPDGVVFAAGYSNGTSDLVGFVGGGATDNLGNPILPTTSPVYLSHGFTPVGNVYTFSTDFVISSSVVLTAGVPASQDAFAFTFRNGTLGANGTLGSGNNVFSIDFAPQAGNAGVDAVRFTTYNLAGVSNGQTSTFQGVSLDSRYHLGVSANILANTLTISLQPESSLGVLGGTAFSQTYAVPVGSLLAGVTSFAATDILTNPLNPGSNSLLFDNLSAVPEPSTYAMLGLGLVGLAARFRRKARA